MHPCGAGLGFVGGAVQDSLHERAAAHTVLETSRGQAPWDGRSV